MPAKPKQRVARLLNCLSLMQSGRCCNANELATAFSVSRRQIFRDIAFLQNCGVPVEFDHERGGYVHNGDLRVTSTINADEWSMLLSVVQSLSGPSGMVPFVEASSRAAEKLVTARPSPRESQWTGDGGLSIHSDVQWRCAEEHKPHFDRVRTAMVNRRCVRIHCALAVPGRTLRTLLSPYRLLFLSRGWFAIGRSSYHRTVRTFPIQRILDSEITHYCFDAPPGFRLDRYFGKAWRLLRGVDRGTKVVVRFSRLVSESVSSIIWHPSQQLLPLPDGRVEFSARVDGIEEIASWIRSFGDEAEALAPLALRTQTIRLPQRLEARQSTG